MDLLILKSLVFPLCFIGHSIGQNVVAVGPLKAYLGENVTLKILVVKKQNDIINWNFKSGNLIHVATLRQTNLAVHDRYKGRASIDSANGDLTLTSVKLEDSGNYVVNIVGESDTLTGIVGLLVVDVLHPSLTLLPPSIEQLQQEKFTLVCLANEGLPSDWRLHWIINTTSQVEWEEEWSPEMLQEDGSYSWRSSITITVENWKKIFSLTCTARLGSLAPISITLKTDQSSEAQSDSLDGS